MQRSVTSAWRWSLPATLLAWALSACMPALPLPSPSPLAPLPDTATSAPAASTATADYALPATLAVEPSAVPPTAEPVCTPTSAWSLELKISGGFAGVARSLTVSSRGQLTAVDERSQETATTSLSPQDLADLEPLVCAASQSPAAARLPACNDCFNYVLTISDGVTPHTWTWNDISLRDHPAVPLVQALRLWLQDLLDAP